MTLDKLKIRAKSFWSNHLYRCKNPKSKNYKTYGARGIQVKYSLPEFREWFLNNFDPTIKDPVVSRIDHDSHYEIGNIKFESRADNTRELQTRHKNPGLLRSKAVYCYSENELICVLESSRQAARHFNVSQCVITNSCSNKSKVTKMGLKFSYEEIL